tara:strand:- start:9857 stop:10033 length:177 start_codon:yes stop_codon:yes gene_type:complete
MVNPAHVKPATWHFTAAQGPQWQRRIKPKGEGGTKKVCTLISEQSADEAFFNRQAAAA